MRSAYQWDKYSICMDIKTTKILATEITVVSIILLGVGITTGLSYYGTDLYKRAACLDKVQEFAREGVVREAGGFNGGISECSQIQWLGSIYS
jgi:hypothetical protein